MPRLASLLALAVAFSSCAALKQGLKDASEGIKPNPAAIPEGAGWYCYVANERKWSGCWRTQQECNAERDSNKTFYQVDTFTFQKWGACNPVSQAYCLTSEKMQVQSDGTGKYEPTYDCMPDDLSCSDLSEARLREAGQMRTSSCGTFK